MNKKKTVVAGAVGECVHVAGVTNFLRLAEMAGWRAVFLGPAVPIEKMLEAARKENADLVGVSYRLTPETGERLLADFAEEADDLHRRGVRFAFGGTPPVAERAQSIGFFEQVFDGSENPEQVLQYLREGPGEAGIESNPPQTTVERIQWKSPYPLLRHHFGLPSMEESIAGIEKIAEAKALDVISLGTDQDAQENFFHPERQELRRKGAGGVPVRSPQDYRDLYAASRCGNYPLMRTYSGTDDFIRLAEVFMETIKNAWCAIPLFWFNQMDGRGPWDLEGSIREHQKVMQWYGGRNVPVELNEPHHWGMRDAPDVVFVVSGYLSAYNARAFGVKDYIAQFMFNSPPGLSDGMDLARMAAILEMVLELETEDFRIWRQVRTGLLSLPLNAQAAKGHLAASTYMQMALRPHIVHIVGHSEAHHAATPQDIIEDSQLVRRAIENAIKGQPEMISDNKIRERKDHLIREAKLTLDAIRQLGGDMAEDPLINPGILAIAVTGGILDAPQLKNNPFGRGLVRTSIINGACEAVGEEGKVLPENERLKRLSSLQN